VSRGTLETRVRYFVEVCRFTFRFNTLEEIRRYLEFFRSKVRPSSRIVVRDVVQRQMTAIADDARARGVRITKPYGHQAPERRWWLRQFIRAERDSVQTPFERLPMYLLKDKNRLRVVRALETALAEFK
jgi:hypothetical protein